jgi:hypothetical protein
MPRADFIYKRIPSRADYRSREPAVYIRSHYSVSAHEMTRDASIRSVCETANIPICAALRRDASSRVVYNAHTTRTSRPLPSQLALYAHTTTCIGELLDRAKATDNRTVPEPSDERDARFHTVCVTAQTHSRPTSADVAPLVPLSTASAPDERLTRTCTRDILPIRPRGRILPGFAQQLYRCSRFAFGSARSTCAHNIAHPRA